MNVHIIAQQVQPDLIEFVMIAKTEQINMISPVQPLDRHSPHGNPYLLYGDEAKKFAGTNDIKLTVSVMTSGDIPWD